MSIHWKSFQSSFPFSGFLVLWNLYSLSDDQAILSEIISSLSYSLPSSSSFHNSKVSLKKLFATRPQGVAGILSGMDFGT